MGYSGRFLFLFYIIVMGILLQTKERIIYSAVQVQWPFFFSFFRYLEKNWNSQL